MFKAKKTCIIILFVIGCILSNCIGKAFAEACSLPLWLDAIGTVISAYALGPVCGAIIGASTNIIYALNTSWVFVSYAVVSMAIGVTVGICSKKGFLENIFGILSTCFLVAIISVILSMPFNYIFFDGEIGNVWGDSVIALLQKYGCNKILSQFTGQFYLDFIDKIVTVLTLVVIVKIRRRYLKGKKNITKTASVIITAVIAANAFSPLFINDAKADSGDNINYDTYIQTVYNGLNGLPGGMANDIAQSKNGILWVGTYGGLYRYNGRVFRLMEEFDTVKNVNCLYTDESGRLWIGTNDDGISICINETIVNSLTDENGLPSDSVRCITQCSDGEYYVGTTSSLAILKLSNGLSVYEIIPEIIYAISVSSDKNGNVCAVTNDGDLYLINDGKIIDSITDGSFYTCCRFDENGTLYAGTSENNIDIFAVTAEGLNISSAIICGGLSHIKSIYFSDDGRRFVCADNGAGYIDSNMSYHNINTNTFDNSIDNMMTDYQGNLWFTSSRLGLLHMCESIFTELYPKINLRENVVNTTASWQGRFYFGTDSGLDMTNGDISEVLSDSLTQSLENVRVRNLMVDSKNHMWISTSGKGVWEVSQDGEVTRYTSEAGMPGDKMRMALELSDGTVAAAGDSGIAYIKDKKIISVTNAADGLSNPRILCMLEKQDGTLLAGSDGNGIAVIKDGAVIKTLKKSDGLVSDVILKMRADLNGEGVFIVTGSGLCYMENDGSIRPLSNFPYYNNYDLIEGGNGTLFVLSSAGIYVVNKYELLSGNKLNYEILDSKKGLINTLTPNSWNYRDNNDNLFISTDSGVVHMNLNKYDIPVRSYRMLLKTIKADDKLYNIEEGEPVYIQSGVSRIEIVPEIVNYSVNSPYVKIWLEGFENTPRIVTQEELGEIVYTNLPTGSYTFHLATLDGKDGRTIAETTCNIIKEKEFYDNWWFRLYVVGVFAIAVAYLTWLFVRTQIQKTIKMHEREIELARKQIKMGDETIVTIAQAVDAKDENTSQHSTRVSEYAVLIAKKLGYGEDECEELRKTALLHDIGKIGIPDNVLNKPARLTDEEYEIMKSHVVLGAKILENFTLVKNVSDGALYHHERYDGRGYVNGLKGKEIPLNARIIGIADAFDAMTANRVYRKKLDFDFVLEELKKGRGTQFDPEITDILIDLIRTGAIDVDKIYKS